MKFYKRRAAYAELRNYCHLSKHEVLEVCEWYNGEGWDITLGDRTFQLTHGELQALTVLCNVSHKENTND